MGSQIVNVSNAGWLAKKQNAQAVDAQSSTKSDDFLGRALSNAAFGFPEAAFLVRNYANRFT